MILILSDENDLSTIHICEWLIYWGVPFFRINLEDSIVVERIYIKNKNDYDVVIVKNGTHRFSTRNVKAYWYSNSRFVE
jgi:hypothetical protein